MRVGFNARLLAHPNTRGWNRYTVNLLAELPNVGVRPILYTDRPIHPDHLARLPVGAYDLRVGPVRPYLLWEQVWLPRQCSRDGVDLLHAPANFGLPWRSRCPRVLTLHDAIGASGHGPRARLFHGIARRSAHAIITVSEHAKGEIVQTFNVSSDRIHFIYEGADPAVCRPVSEAESIPVKERYQIVKPYFFYVGGWEERKNLPFLIRAFADAKLADIQLVVAGFTGDLSQARRFTDQLFELDVYANVVDTPQLPDSDLAALYSGALAFIYPSKHEGFGLQLCEAMAHGCPVLAARATSLPEVLGNGGETFSLENTSELVGLMRRVADDPLFREDLARRARERSAFFSWRKTAEQTATVYQELID